MRRRRTGHGGLLVQSAPGPTGQFKIIEYQELVAAGTVGADRHLRLKLRTSDLYSLRAYTRDAVLPYDLMYFEVEPCLRVRPTCHGLALTNPHEYAAYTVSYSVDDGPDKTIMVAPEKPSASTCPRGRR